MTIVSNRVAVGAIALLTSVAAHAVNGISLEGGYTDEKHNTRDGWRGGGAIVWDWGVKWLPFGNWYLGGQWELSGSYWHAETKGRTGKDVIGEVGITPVFRIQTDTPIAGVYPFLEGAIGAHFLSDTGFGDAKLGINYTFGDHLGAGLRFGERGQYELNYRYQHLSNAGLGDDNNGINFHLIRFGYRW